MNSKHYWIVSKNGKKYVQTSNKYLAHSLSFMRFQFMTFDTANNKIYSFEYSEELIGLIEHILELRESHIY